MTSGHTDAAEVPRVPRWCVVDAVPRRDWSILLTFVGGEKKVFDARPLLECDYFARIRNIGFFMLARVEFNTVVWSDDIDVAPEYLYDASVPLEATDG